MDVKGKIKVAGVQCDDAALLSRVMPANWRTWNVPEMTSQSMNYGAAREITGDVDTRRSVLLSSTIDFNIFKHFFKLDAEIRYLEHHHHSGRGRRMDGRQ